MKKSGVLISFEGIDGSGKSTQAKLLADFLQKKNYQVSYIREPGGTAISEAIRKILLDRRNSGMHPRTELLLFLAARAELVDKVILPAIRRGSIVVTDRFHDSTFAYQIYGRRLPGEIVRLLNSFAVRTVNPDLTFLVDLDVRQAHRRLAHAKDRMEGADRAFHSRVRKGFLALAKEEPRRIKLLDGNRAEEEIWENVRAITTRVLRRRGFEFKH